MKKQNDGGPAFPIAFRMNDKQVILEDGISVRDYFAAANWSHCVNKKPCGTR